VSHRVDQWEGLGRIASAEEDIAEVDGTGQAAVVDSPAAAAGGIVAEPAGAPHIDAVVSEKLGIVVLALDAVGSGVDVLVAHIERLTFARLE
jgi:hypothetical protein